MTIRPPFTSALVEQRLGELQQLVRLGTSLADAETPPIERRVLLRRSVCVVGRAPGGSDARDVILHVTPVAIDRHLGWMPDAWFDPFGGEITGVALSLLVGATVDGRAVDALPRGRGGTITLRLLAPRPACVDALPLLERSDHRPRLWLALARDRARTRW